MNKLKKIFYEFQMKQIGNKILRTERNMLYSEIMHNDAGYSREQKRKDYLTEKESTLKNKILEL